MLAGLVGDGDRRIASVLRPIIRGPTALAFLSSFCSVRETVDAETVDAGAPSPDDARA